MNVGSRDEAFCILLVGLLPVLWIRDVRLSHFFKIDATGLAIIAARFFLRRSDLLSNRFLRTAVVFFVVGVCFGMWHVHGITKDFRFTHAYGIVSGTSAFVPVALGASMVTTGVVVFAINVIARIGNRLHQLAG